MMLSRLGQNLPSAIQLWQSYDSGALGSIEDVLGDASTIPTTRLPNSFQRGDPAIVAKELDLTEAGLASWH
jgi:hypothetical protein